jgi:putative tricarboxylic transport membrane protein
MDASVGQHYLHALALVADPYVLLVVLCSAIYGLFVGCIPGLTATLATALLVPITFFMPPVPAVAAIVTASARPRRRRTPTRPTR